MYKRGEYWQFRLWLPKENKYARRSLRTRSESTAIERGKAAYLEIYGNLQQGKSYFSITTKEGVEKYLSFRKRDVELGHIVSGRLATIATHLQHWLSFIGKDTKLKELERTDCENYFYHRQKSTNLNSLFSKQANPLRTTQLELLSNLLRPKNRYPINKAVNQRLENAH